MMYAITFVYRLSDFLAVAQGHGVERVYLTSCWLKENDPEGSSEHWQWTDVHELSFMGAFGIGYKMQIDGGTHLGRVADNHRLWIKAKAVEAQVGLVWRRMPLKRKPVEMLVVAGTLIRTDVFGHTRVPWESFIANKIPESVPVHDFTTDKPERS